MILPKLLPGSKRNQIFRHLENWKGASLNEKLYTVHFLACDSVGHTSDEIYKALCYFGADPAITKQQLGYIFRNGCLKSKIFKKNGISNIPEIVQSDVDERYAMIPDNDLNKKLFKDCLCISVGYLNSKTGKESHVIHQPMFCYKPEDVSYFGSIQKKKSSLLVLDYDRKDFDNDLQKCWDYAKTIFSQSNLHISWDFFKFSGSEGFHLIKEVPKCSNLQLKRFATMIDEQELFDPAMFQANRRIRGFNFNLKGGKMSIPVKITDKLTNILTEAKK